MKTNQKQNTIHGVLSDRFLLIGRLGDEGGHAVVWNAIDCLSGLQVAIKQMKITKNKNPDKIKLKMLTENNSMLLINHPNVLKSYAIGMGDMVRPESKTENWMFMVLELAQPYTLFDYVVKTGAFPEKLAVFCFKQIVDGLQAIHTTGLSHRDIKSENILLGHDCKLKIADFGFAAQATGLTDKAGTEGQFAPEIESLESGHTYNGQWVDVFNLGIVLFNMVFRSVPFLSASQSDPFYYQIIQDDPNEFWNLHQARGLKVQAVSESCRTLILALLHPSP